MQHTVLFSAHMDSVHGSPAWPLLLQHPACAREQAVVCRLLATSKELSQAVPRYCSGMLAVDLALPVVYTMRDGQPTIYGNGGASPIRAARQQRADQAAWLTKHSSLVQQLNTHEVWWAGPGTEGASTYSAMCMQCITSSHSAADWGRSNTEQYRIPLLLPPSALAAAPHLRSLTLDLTELDTAACSSFMCSFVGMTQLTNLDLSLGLLPNPGWAGLQYLPAQLQRLTLAIPRSRMPFGGESQVELPPGLLSHLTALRELQLGSVIAVPDEGGVLPANLRVLAITAAGAERGQPWYAPEPPGTAALQQLQQLQLLDLSGAEMTAEQLQQLSALCALSELRLVYTGDVEQPAAALDAWAGLPVKQLALEAHGETHYATSTTNPIAATLKQLPLVLPGLTHLSLRCTRGYMDITHGELAAVLQQLRQLQVFKLGLSKFNIWAVAIKFRQAEGGSLGQIEQQAAAATSAGAEALAEAVYGLPHLQHLVLATDLSSTSFVQLVAAATGLTSLQLPHFGLTDSHVCDLVAGLAGGKLRELDISNNVGVTDAALPLLVQLAPQLWLLNIEGTRVTWEGFAGQPLLQQMKQRQGVVVPTS